MGKVRSYWTIKAVICPRSRVLTLNIDLTGVLVEELPTYPQPCNFLDTVPTFQNALRF